MEHTGIYMTNTHAELNETPRPRSRGLVIGLLIVAIVVIVAVGAVVGLVDGNAHASASGAAPMEMPPMPVDVAIAELGEVVDAVSATGRIEAVQAVELRSDEQGRVLELLFREGQAVAAGTPLVRLDDALLRAQAARARAERDLARQQLARAERLRAESAASPADLERADAGARSAEAALWVLELQIERSTVRAPFAGRVGQRFVSVGDYVTTATPLLTIQTTDPQRAVIDVPERYAGDLQVGQEVEFTIAAEPGRTFTGRVEFIDPVVQPETRMIVVKARAPNRDHVLKAGMFIEASLAIATRSGAVVVPEDAVQPLRTANVVWAVVDGKASRRVVTLGTRSRGVVEIVEGVAAGEQVVVGGLERMQEGMPVAPQPRGTGG
jgi:membrane fusion protein (multidrug efflux system)